MAALDPACDARTCSACARRRDRTPEHPPPGELTALTCNVIRHLLTSLITEATRRLTDPLGSSRWRRRHQHRAHASHYATKKLSSRDHDLRLEYYAHHRAHCRPTRHRLDRRHSPDEFPGEHFPNWCWQHPNLAAKPGVPDVN